MYKETFALWVQELRVVLDHLDNLLNDGELPISTYHSRYRTELNDFYCAVIGKDLE